MIRVRYKAMEFNEGVVEYLDADKYVLYEDHSVELRRFNPETGKYRVVGTLHPDRWDSIVVMEDAEDDKRL